MVAWCILLEAVLIHTAQDLGTDSQADISLPEYTSSSIY